MLVRDQFAHDELAADVRHVATREEFTAALYEGAGSGAGDYKLPGYNGLDASS